MRSNPFPNGRGETVRTPVFRFAPSPNGYLHLGHALSALIDFEMARALAGRFLLRIEDIDATRCRPEFEQAIYRRPRLARHRVGGAGAAPVRASRVLSRRAGEARREASSIRASRAAPRSRATSRSATPRDTGRAIPTARRSIPGTRSGSAPRNAAPDGGRALRAAARHERRGGAHRRAHLGRDRRRPDRSTKP